MSEKVGIVGCGGISRSHVEGYRAAGAEIVALTDANPAAAKKLSDELGGVAIYADFRKLVDEGKPDVISVCSPPVAHEEAAVHALGRGVHVLCEKPMAYDVPSAHRMRDAAKKSQALLMPAFRHRFLPAIVALREIVAAGTIGDIVFFNNVFCGPMPGMEKTWFTKKAVAGGGSLLDTNSHSVDLFRFMVGEIADQKAVMHRHFKTTDVEDAGILIAEAANGAVGAMESSFVAGIGMAFIHIMGTKGLARYNYGDGTVRVHLTDGEEESRPVQESWGFVEEVEHFLGAVRGKHGLAVTVEDGVRAMEVICAVY
jgi:predicted dehydrogenase